MANKRRCINCRAYHKPDIEGAMSGVAGFTCSQDCRIEYATKNRKSLSAKGKKAKQIEWNKEKKERKKKLMTRSDWYSKLERLVNQYVRWRDRDKPCCTCGNNNPNIKYDAGHFFTKAARPDIRFELTNIHKQCSVNCNQHGSGMRAEYQDFIIRTYGKDHLDWLTERKSDLKEQFPSVDDVEAEIIRYRKMLRDKGLKPVV